MQTDVTSDVAVVRSRRVSRFQNVLVPSRSNVLALVFAAGCAHSVEVVTTTSPVVASENDDPAPAVIAADPSLDFEGPNGIENHSELRFRFDVAAFDNAAARAEADRLFTSHAGFLRAHPGAIPSVQTVVTYAKQLDDTIYAGVQYAVQAGLQPAAPAKRAVVADTLAYLLAHRSPAADDAIIMLAAAAHAAGDAPALPADLAPRLAGFEHDFDQDTARSKPIGFYTWSDELRAIWRQDRLLQTALFPPAACAVARAIVANPARTQHYLQLVRLQAAMTNPPESTLADLLPIAGKSACTSQLPHAFLGASRTVEDALYSRLYPMGAPPDADLMRDLVEAIRAGLDLAPKPEDGWYQHQTWALETLLVTDKAEERAKIAFTARYHRRLREAFSTLLTQHRETHIESVGAKSAGAAPPPRVPNFRLEPLATAYVRHARSYVFLESALEQVLGPAMLDAASALGASGPEAETLRARIRRACDLFYGAYLMSCEDLGMRPRLDAPGDPPKPARAELIGNARRWLAELSGDALAAADVRVIVPIAQLGHGRAKYWAVIGVRTTLAGYSYLWGSAMSQPSSDDMARVPLPTEQFLEVTSSATPPTREEFRALCDKQQTAAAIKAALEAR